MTTDAVGGVWQYSTELATALRPLGVETVLAVMGPNSLSLREQEGGAQRRKGEDDQHAPLDIIHTNLPLDWLATSPTEVTRSAAAIAALATEVNADLIHLNSPTLAADTRFPVPVVAVAHGCIAAWWEAAHGTPPTPDYAWHADLMAQGLAAADAVVAPSAAFAATIQRLYDHPTAPLVVHNGRTAPPPSDTPATPSAFTAGRLWDPVKNTALLDQVAALLDTPFRAAGPLAGPHGETVSVAHLDHLGILSDAEIAQALASRPIHVSATRFEPFGLSVLEAALAGCPLVLSNIDTFRELWTGAALLVADETPEAYAAAIRRIEADPALRTHLGEAARLRAARYTPAAMAGAMAAIYAGLLTPSLQSAA
ncbi:glycosyltransferase family 4 protein [Sphingomonas rubra]|uniref:Glycosyltransferase involved in cell wall bisynthesis n=1 Tax=Sphingomonas rubra TaxID=634430 RepID=A0A1I5TKA2_9SPHN|nr:glycosyltransferase family 4 protein [Sphingomonas rubra]SFP83499.1 Glycosyltransferase involved in cell wall bisynthesis [Sphingomonas rubra]